MIVLVTNNQISDNDARHVVTSLSQFFHLPTLTTIVFGSTCDVSRWKEIQFILQYVESIV